MDIHELIELANPLHASRYKPEGTIGPLVQDSRQAEKGCVFIAVKGTEVDGHMFLEDAIQQGASVLICEESFYTEAESVCILEVEDSRSLIGPLAQAFEGNPAKQMRIVGITGTNGKTTTATLVYQILCHAGEKASLLGTVAKRILTEAFDSKLTTSDPIELAADMKMMVEAGSDFLIMEVSSHALHQKRVAGIDFGVAAFTNLSHDHLDYHETVEEYASAKKLLFDGLSESATAIINMDDEQAEFMISNCKAKAIELSFEDSDTKILSSSPNGLKLSVKGTQIQTSLIGNFNAYNVAEAFLICKALGVEKEKIVAALTEVKGAPGRMEAVNFGQNEPKVIVDYAHTPDALVNVLSTLRALKENEQQLFVVFGAGGDRDAAKRPEMAKAAEAFADEIIVTSDNPRTEDPDLIIADILQGFEETANVTTITSRKEAIDTAINRAGLNDIILIAGKGHEDYQEIDGVRHDFDDRLVAKEALRLKKEEEN